MSNTAMSLAQTLKEVWTEERMGAQLDLSRAMNRQLYTPSYMQVPVRVDMSPTAVRLRKQRQNEMMQRLAAAKRGNKPSYRQRQKNARKAREGR